MRTVTGSTLLAAAVAAVSLILVTPPAGAQSATEPTAAELAEQIRTLKREYEARIGALESQLSVLESRAQDAEQESATPARASRPVSDNAFNPAIGVVLNGMISEYSADESEIPGFPTGHESERPARGLSLGHSEITMSSSIDDKFFGSLTLGLGVHPGEPTELELEEAYIQTLPGAGLPEGMRIKAGRALWTFGYLNEQHRHGDDFADRPLPYRTFLDSAYNDDGAELSLVLPSDLYSEIGAGLFRGDDTPFGGSNDGLDAWSVYTRFGGDFGRDSAWRVGAYVLSGEAHERGGGHAHGDEDMHHEDDHDDDDHDDDNHHDDDGHDDDDDHDDEHGHSEFFSEGMFSGDTRLYALDFRSTWAPTGNARERELILQGEYFWRTEKGTYELAAEGDEEVGESEYFDTTSRGWYAQAIYKFLPRWRIGARYSQLLPSNEMELDHDPTAVAAMIDWTNSEFSRVRLQYTRESLAEDEDDNQIMLQYITSLGAHPAHTF
ncbi:MAG: hypothetical protein OXU81_16170 [Gammaproteobacteria bacterium]|nr:hypothetical protein [Gammaproteobacteria bacterium]